MNEDDAFTAKVRDSATYTRFRARSTSELGATYQFHADCPCCGYRFSVDHSDAEKSVMDRENRRLKAKVWSKIQSWFTNGPWKWKTFRRLEDTDSMVRSQSIEMVCHTGAGPGLDYIYRRNRRKGVKLWFAIMWHRAPVVGEMFFACKLSDFFSVLQGIADDAPEFAWRLRQAADNALKRDGSANRGGGYGQVPTQGVERGREPFDESTAVRV